MLFGVEVRCQVCERGHTYSESHVRIRYAGFYAGKRLWANECDAIGKNGQYVSRWAGVATLLQPSAGSVPGGQGLLREQGSQQCKHIGVWVDSRM